MSKKNFAWNSIAGLLNAAEAVIMTMVVTRVTTLSDAGILTLAFAVGNLFLSIGKFGVRNYQVSDGTRKYSFAEYATVRIISSILMIIATVIYDVYKYSFEEASIKKVVVITTICAIYLIEAFEDLLWGELQRLGRLDVGAKLFISRWSSILVVFVMAIIRTKSLILSIIIAFGVSVVVSVANTVYVGKKYHFFVYNENGVQIGRIKKLILETAPLFVVSFLTFYINNASKYAIDNVLNDEVQACFGFVVMPVFVIGLLNSMIYQPSVVWLSEQWLQHKIDSFKKRIRRQCLYIVVIGCICVLGAWCLGIPVLSILYNTDLHNYLWELIILQIAGMFLAVSGYLSVVLTIMRKQTLLMYGYIMLAVLSFVSMKKVAQIHGTLGVSVAYLVGLIGLSAYFIVLYYIELRKLTRK